MTFIKTVRGTEVEIHIENSEYDPSVGIMFCHCEVYASTLDGKPFDLTDEESEQIGIEAGEMLEHDPVE